MGFWHHFVHLHDTIIMGAIVLNGTTVNDYYPGVTVNGTAIQEVYFNGTKYWSRYPYPPGTDVFTFGYCPGGNILDFINYYNSYPLVFSGSPYLTQGGGYPDSILYVPISPGFQVVAVSNGQRGYFATGTNVGSSFSLGMYRTFTCFLGDVTSYCGNGCSQFTMRYVGN